MRIALLCLALFPLGSLADTYVCQQGGKRVISTSPCDASAQTVNVVRSEAPIAPAPSSTSQTENFQRQLDRVKQNRADLAAGVNSTRNANAPVAHEAPKADKAAMCEKNWEAIRAVDAQMRAYSSDYWKNERVRLQDERWRLGC